MSNPGPASTSTTTYVGGGSPQRVGNAATDLVGFYGATPVVQASALTAVGTSAPVAACATFGLTSTQLSAMITAVNSIITALKNVGITA